jgi:hypothetical protein
MPALYLTLLSLPGWLVFGVIPCAFRLGPCHRRITHQAMILLGGAVMLVLLCRFDPTGYIEWLLD